MSGHLSRRNVFAGIVGLALLGGVFAGVQEVQAVRLARAGAAAAWPAGACQQVDSFGLESGADRAGLVCWSSDFTLSVPEPGVR
ncbi:MAG TPA: hypothetical protein VFE37_22835 [Chloroflexota bacterium]|nr:hypothetical protein [Chloroflexota bacterium]